MNIENYLTDRVDKELKYHEKATNGFSASLESIISAEHNKFRSLVDTSRQAVGKGQADQTESALLIGKRVDPGQRSQHPHLKRQTRSTWWAA